MSEVHSSSRRWDALGVLLLVVALSTLPRQLVAPIDVYDEGLVLTYADHLLHGAVPYRDFYTNYPPGVFLLVAFVQKLCGTSVLAVRLLGLGTQAAIACLAGRMAARAADNGRRIAWLAVGATFLWLRHGPIWPTAWMGALACLLWAFELAGRARSSALRWGLVGLVVGLAGTLRHDLCAYTAVGLCAVGIAARMAGRRVPWPPVGALAAGLLGVLLPLAACFGWVLVEAGPRRIYLDLYFDQVHAMLPGRLLPLPPLWKFERLSLGVWIGFAAPLVWLAAAWRGRRSLDWIGLGVLALAGLPQMTNRTDTHHVVYGLAPGLAILAVTVAGWPTSSPPRAAGWILRVLGLVLLLGGALGLRWKPAASWTDYRGVPRAGITLARSEELAGARERVLEFVGEHTLPDERIFVGCHQHARVFVSEMDLYFLCDRRGAVRRMQFDPNLTNRCDEQQMMIAELERNETRVVVLSPCVDPHEPNDSAKTDCTLLDDWLARHFRVVEEAGPYRLMLRDG